MNRFLLVALVAAILLLVVLSAFVFMPMDEDELLSPDLGAPVSQEAGNQSRGLDYAGTNLEKKALTAEDRLAQEEEEPPEFPSLQEPGWKIWGKVTCEEDGEPIPGATVRLSIEFNEYDDMLHLEPCATDGEGVYAISVPLPFEHAEYAPCGTLSFKVWGVASKVGYETRDEETGGHFKPALKHEVVQLDFSLDAGMMMRGLVLNADGVPVYNAWVDLWDENREYQDLWMQTNQDGAYGIHLSSLEQGTHYLAAHKAGEGVSQVVQFFITRDQDMEMPVLRFRRGGVIEGSVTTPTGSPVADIHVHAYPAMQIDKDEQVLVRHEMPVMKTAWEGADPVQGLESGAARTDSQGRFTLSGLQEGEYFVRPSGFASDQMGYSQQTWSYEGEADSDGYDIITWRTLDFYPGSEEVRVRCRTGDRDVRILLPLYLLEVTLVDDRGHLVLGSDLEVEYEGGRWRDPVQGGCQTVQIKPGPVHLFADSGEIDDDLIYYRGEQDLFVAEGEYQTRATQVLRHVPKGKLRVRYVMENGDPFEALSHLRIRVYGEAGSMGCSASDMDRDGEGACALALPAGSYTMEVRPRGCLNVDPDHPYAPMPLYRHQYVKGIRVSEGENTNLTVTLRPGGRLELTLTSDEEGLDSFYFDTDPRRPGEIRERKYRIRLTPLDGGESKNLSRFESLSGSLNFFDTMNAGHSYVYQNLICPGRYVLDVIPRGCIPVTRTVTIQPHEITKIALKMQRSY